MAPTSSSAKVVRLPSSRVQVVTASRAAPSGSGPVLCLCNDGRDYWCKSPLNTHGPEVIVNEVVASEVGRILGAPVREWAIVEVPQELVGTRVGPVSRLTSPPMFGSLALPTVAELYDVQDVEHDGNSHRIPYLVALWLLCHADDIQMMYDLDADRQIWSFDFGFWFGSMWELWGLDLPDSVHGRTKIPFIPGGTESVAWDEAIEAVESLTPEKLAHVPRLVPEAWGVAQRNVEQLTQFVLDRVPYTVKQLQVQARKTAKRK